MQETHTIATIDINKQQLLNMAFNAKRLQATEYKKDAQGNRVLNSKGALNRIAAFIKSEDATTFDRDRLKLGTDADSWFFSYYNDGNLYRLMKDGRIRMESADADDMIERQYEEFCDLINKLLVQELSVRLYNSVLTAAHESIKQTNIGFKVTGMKIIDNNTCVLAIS